MADALGGQWVRRGHDVMIGGRSSERATALATRIGATPGALAEAAAFGEVLLLAVPYDAAPAAPAEAGVMPGRIVLDCTNPVIPGRFTLATSGRSAAELFADQVPEARVVKRPTSAMWTCGE